MPRKTNLLRLILILILIVSFVVLCKIFITQYKQYNEVENRLNNAYSNNSKLSPTLYNLFSTFSEVDNLFRLYAISFDNKNLKNYQLKLDTLATIIHSLDSLPQKSEISKNNNQIEILDRSSASQFVSLKKQIDDLILFADENLANSEDVIPSIQKSKTISSDSVIDRILNDTLLNVKSNADTIIRKKQGLLKRIFNTQNDTLLNQNNTQVLNVNQIDVIQRNIENLIKTNEASYNKNFKNLRNLYLLSKEKERRLITSNYTLINELKKTIESIQEGEYQKYREAEKEDYILYKENTQKFRTYAIMALCVILLMIIFIMYYQYVVSKYEDKLIKEKDYASKLAEEKTSLLANISHEIRSPLNSLKGVVKLLNSNNGHEIDSKLLNSIDYDINVINNSVNDILNLSKIESDSIEVKLDDVYISKIIDDTFNLHKFQAAQKGLKFDNSNNLNVELRIHSNEFRLRQIISNLISNAIKYTNKGSITVKSYSQNDKIIVDVIDTGIGIEDKKIDQIFRKYYTVEKENTRGGFGLGLHISQLLAKQIGGKLVVKSQQNIGSTFTLILPNKKNVLLNKKDEQERNIPREIISNDTSIVFIDDNKLNLLLAKQTFANFSKFKSFDEPKKALEYLENNTPDIVITDIIMPEITGWAILEKIKSNKSSNQTKVYAHTAEDSMIEINKSSYDFDGILSKGFDIDTLSKLYLS